MQLENLLGKVTSKADLLGKLYGYLVPMTTFEQTDPISGIMSQHEQAFDALMKGKFPKLENVINGLRDETIAAKPFKNGLLAYIIGEIAGGFIGSKNANALKKFGAETMKYSAISSAVVTWNWNPHKPSSASSSRRSHGNTNPMRGVYA